MMTAEAALGLAHEAMVFLAERPEDLARMAAETGLAPGDLRGLVENADAMAALVAFVRSDEERAAAFCEEARRTPEALEAAEAMLSGGAPHWT